MPISVNTISTIKLPNNSNYILKDGTLVAGEGIDIAENVASGTRTISTPMSIRVVGITDEDTWPDLCEGWSGSAASYYDIDGNYTERNVNTGETIVMVDSLPAAVDESVWSTALQSGRLYTWIESKWFELVTMNTLSSNVVTAVKGAQEQAYRTGNVNITPANIGAIPTTGGEVTGAIIRKTDWDYSGTRTGTVSAPMVQVKDKDGVIRHQVYGVLNAENTAYTFLSVRDGTNTNHLALGLDANGNPVYTIASPAAFRSAIDAISLSDIVLKTGTTSLGTVAASTRGSTDVTFTSVGTANYIVIVNPVLGDFGFGIQNKTATSFRLYYRNNDTQNSRTATFYWAIIKVA